VTYPAVLVDDDPLFRDWLRSLLAGSKDFEVLGEACNGAGCIVLLNTVNPHVVVLDVYMPDWDGLELAQHIKTHFAGIKTIITSSHSDRVYSRIAAENGAGAFIPKADLSTSALLRALEAAPVP